LPFIPGAVLAGTWHDSTGTSLRDPLALAIDAIKTADREQLLSGPAADLADTPDNIERATVTPITSRVTCRPGARHVLREPRGEQ